MGCGESAVSLCVPFWMGWMMVVDRHFIIVCSFGRTTWHVSRT